MKTTKFDLIFPNYLNGLVYDIYQTITEYIIIKLNREVTQDLGRITRVNLEPQVEVSWHVLLLK